MTVVQTQVKDEQANKIDAQEVRNELLKSAGYGQERSAISALLFASPLLAIAILGFIALGGWRYVAIDKTLVFCSAIWLAVGVMFQSGRTIASGAMALLVSLVYAGSLG